MAVCGLLCTASTATAGKGALPTCRQCLKHLSMCPFAGAVCTGGGGFHKGTFSFFSLVPKFSHGVLFRNLGYFLLFVHPLSWAVAKYRCAVVGSQSFRHVRSSCSLGSEKLVVVKQLYELDSIVEVSRILWPDTKIGGLAK